MTYTSEIRWHKKAVEDIDSLPKNIAERIFDKVENYGEIGLEKILKKKVFT